MALVLSPGSKLQCREEIDAWRERAMPVRTSVSCFMSMFGLCSLDSGRNCCSIPSLFCQHCCTRSSRKQLQPAGQRGRFAETWCLLQLFRALFRASQGLDRHENRQRLNSRSTAEASISDPRIHAPPEKKLMPGGSTYLTLLASDATAARAAIATASCTPRRQHRCVLQPSEK